MQPLFKFALRVSGALLACALAGAASAHPVLVTPRAEAGSFQKVAIGITHGCSGVATREVIVMIPPGVEGAKPMVKPGWNVEIERARLAQPRVAHGRTVTEDVSKIRWSGGTLASAHYDEFIVVATLPQQPGPIYWAVSQVCEQGRADWTDIPAPGQPAGDLKNPALRLELTPAQQPGHQH
jgi:uncharacterized protein YcnI